MVLLLVCNPGQCHLILAQLSIFDIYALLQNFICHSLGSYLKRADGMSTTYFHEVQACLKVLICPVTPWQVAAHT